MMLKNMKMELKWTPKGSQNQKESVKKKIQKLIEQMVGLGGVGGVTPHLPRRPTNSKESFGWNHPRTKTNKKNT